MRIFRKASINKKLTGVIMLTSTASLLLASVGFLAYDVVTFRDELARNIGILAEDMSQAHGEGEADIGADGDLVDALEFVFHRFLDGDDTFLDGVDGAEEGVRIRDVPLNSFTQGAPEVRVAGIA